MKRIIFYTFALPMPVSGNESKLEQTSKVQGKHVTGIKMRRPNTNGRTQSGKTMASETTWRSAFLTLKERSKEFVEEIPLEDIILATEQGLWFELDIPALDMAQSKIKVTNASSLATSITNTEEFEITLRYHEN